MLITSILLLLTSQQPNDLDSPELASIYEPEPIGFSFDAPGWYGLGILLIGLLLYFLVRFIISYQKSAYRREAVKTLVGIDQTQLEDKDKMKEVLVVLKLVAIKTYGRDKVASLYGMEWLKFLEETGKTTSFSGFSEVVGEMVYSANCRTLDINQFITISKNWIRTHA